MPATDDPAAPERIRDAALNLFGQKGVNRVTIRAIATEAGVSPGLIVHYYASKEGLRRACDAHVVAMMRGTDGTGVREQATRGDASHLAALMEAAAPTRRYLARAFLDGSPEAAALFDEIVELTAAWLAEGVRDGWAHPTERPRARAAIYVSWLLAQLTFSDHLERVLGVDDLTGTDAVVNYSRVAIEMLTHGVFNDDRMVDAWAALEKERKNR